MQQDESDDDELEQFDGNDADEERIKNKSCSINRNSTKPLDLTKSKFVASQEVSREFSKRLEYDFNKGEQLYFGDDNFGVEDRLEPAEQDDAQGDEV